MKNYTLDKVFNYNDGDLKYFVEKNKQTLQQLGEIEDYLKAHFVDMDDAIDALILSVLVGEPLLLVGPPGTAKSNLISVFHQCVNTKVEGDYFHYLLTRFTEPNELFGYFEIDQSGKLWRDPNNVHTIQNARVVFLDEVFNASSAILNSLLTFMNERLFFDRGDVISVNMQCLFGATNDIPNSNDLRAVFDRFLIRWEVNNVDLQPNSGIDTFDKLLHTGLTETYGRFNEHDRTYLKSQSDGDNEILQSLYESISEKKPIDIHYPQLLDEIRAFQLMFKAWVSTKKLKPIAGEDYTKEFARVINNFRQYGYSEMSNRRVIKMLHAMFLHSIYQSVKNKKNKYTMGKDQLQLLRFSVDRWDDGLFDMI